MVLRTDMVVATTTKTINPTTTNSTITTNNNTNNTIANTITITTNTNTTTTYTTNNNITTTTNTAISITTTTVTNPTVVYIFSKVITISHFLKNILYFVLAISRSIFSQIRLSWTFSTAKTKGFAKMSKSFKIE